ncbi:MAG: hypothetical protein WC346_04035 [Methanogenium sp.]|jgi:hypothetical protein
MVEHDMLSDSTLRAYGIPGHVNSRGARYTQYAGTFSREYAYSMSDSLHKDGIRATVRSYRPNKLFIYVVYAKW